MPTHDTTRLIAWDRELRAVHTRLRQSLQIARDAIDKDGPRSADLRLFCTGFCTALDGHHRREDDTMFPEILAAHPDLADVLRELTRDHHMLAHLLGELQRAVDADHDAATLHRHLDGIEAVMETHFRYEEKRLLEPLAALPSAHDPQQMLGPLA